MCKLFKNVCVLLKIFLFTSFGCTVLLNILYKAVIPLVNIVV